MKNIFYVIMYQGETYYQKRGIFGYDYRKARKYKTVKGARRIANTLDDDIDCCYYEYSNMDIVAFDEDWNKIDKLCDWGGWEKFVEHYV